MICRSGLQGMNRCSTTKIEWRPVVGMEGFYEVSSDGRVRSLSRFDRLGRWREGKELSTPFDGRYCYCGMTGGGRRISARVHCLVAEAFLGPRPDGHEVRHEDDDGRHNDFRNLSYGTSKQNSDDQRRNKGFRKGRDHQNTVLTDQQITEIRLLGHGEIGQWADRNLVSRGHVYNVRAGYRRKD